LRPLKQSVLIPKVENAFNDSHSPIDDDTDIALDVVLDDLAWCGNALARARAEGQLVPGVWRAREAAAARFASSGEGLE